MAHRPRAPLVLALMCLLVAPACGGLLDTGAADAVVVIEAEDQPAVLRTRQEVLASAATWGGTRVGETTTDPDETAIEFSLPGESLEVALGAIGELDARVVSTEIDVEADQIERATTTTDGRGRAPDPADRQVRLRVEIAEEPSGGLGAVGSMLLVIFSLVGVVATVRWILRWMRGRREPWRSRSIDRVDLRIDPPTEETPRVPPHRP